MRVIRIPEDPDIPDRVAREVFGGKDKKVFVVAWSVYRWKKAKEEWEAATGKSARRPTLIQTDQERWNQPHRRLFPERFTDYLTARKPDLVVVSDDFVLLPNGFPGGHRTYEDEPASYCPICKIFSVGEDTC